MTHTHQVEPPADHIPLVAFGRQRGQFDLDRRVTIFRVVDTFTRIVHDGNVHLGAGRQTVAHDPLLPGGPLGNDDGQLLVVCVQTDQPGHVALERGIYNGGWWGLGKKQFQF